LKGVGVMNQLSQKKKDLIAGVYVNFKDRRILVLDGISGDAFEGFKGILTKRNAPFENEEVVFFKDLTWFGGGEEGILITDKHFYYYQWGFKQIAIADIAQLRVGGWFDENIVFVLKNGQSVSLWLAKFFGEIKTIIEILQSDDEVAIEIEAKEKSLPVQVQCLGCKAIIRANQNFCEYCRSPVS